MLFIKQLFGLHGFCLVLVCFCFITSCGQEIPVREQQQLESMVDAGGEETEDDSYIQQMERYSRHQLNINEADEDELGMLGMISETQIASLIKYRQMLGRLVSIYELQAVPGWDIALIRKLLPFITVNSGASLKEDLISRFHGGTQTILIRVSQILEKQKGFDTNSNGTKYSGSPQRVVARYKYSYKNLLQFGWTGDKDAGEQFFRGKQRMGFDFNSVHLFAGKIGHIEALALGDYTVNLGQGLIQWQSLAFKKSAETMAVKRQSPVLKPYNSAGEYNFYRGAGMTVRKRNIDWTVFASVRQLSANREEDSSGVFVSSIITTGYHRTPAELADRFVLKQMATGMALRYRRRGLHLGVNAIRYAYSLPVKKKDEPYNLFAMTGRKWMNASMDYSYTFRNMHFFGEMAVDKNMHAAAVHGGMISADQNVDIAIVYRNIAKEYQALNANAFTENAMPSNERGCYIGFSIRLAYGWKLDVFGDFYRFPWLKYLTDAPGYGKDFLFRLSYAPSKQVELQGRLAYSLRTQEDVRTGAIDYLELVRRTSSQFLLNYTAGRSFSFRSRMQLLWLGRNEGETGYSLSIDGICKPPAKPYAVSSRLQLFETSGYDSRLYGFENDVPYSYSIPAVFGKGIRYYVLVQVKPVKRMSVSCRWAQTVYREQSSIGLGLDMIAGNKRSEIKMQWIYAFE